MLSFAHLDSKVASLNFPTLETRLSLWSVKEFVTMFDHRVNSTKVASYFCRVFIQALSIWLLSQPTLGLRCWSFVLFYSLTHSYHTWSRKLILHPSPHVLFIQCVASTEDFCDFHLWFHKWKNGRGCLTWNTINLKKTQNYWHFWYRVFLQILSAYKIIFILSSNKKMQIMYKERRYSLTYFGVSLSW